ncbi:hypothetical protein AVEN_4793-1 [Araneus ventricosus]|uniref:Uncharacterized protein n=1 Tax=Araneus ventricosus TaxID=182803 RepID=A0A4Y2U5X0_ARAVE|nr:hypothetical protein AVEN_92010-1 [Araneus ventricosus]GBO08375.1 hypothetical protein AVEN_4793-1 [Araneus ventricosus]
MCLFFMDSNPFPRRGKTIGFAFCTLLASAPDNLPASPVYPTSESFDVPSSDGLPFYLTTVLSPIQVSPDNILVLFIPFIRKREKRRLPPISLKWLRVPLRVLFVPRQTTPHPPSGPISLLIHQE